MVKLGPQTPRKDTERELSRANLGSANQSGADSTFGDETLWGWGTRPVPLGPSPAERKYARTPGS